MPQCHNATSKETSMITNNTYSTKRRIMTHTKAHVRTSTYWTGLCFTLVFVLAIAVISCSDDPNGSSNGGTKPGVKSCDSIVTTETPENPGELKTLIDTAISR